MQIFVPAETRSGEKRVALVPDIISKLTRAGLSVSIESGAGINAGAPDSEFSNGGATVISASQSKTALSSADVVL